MKFAWFNICVVVTVAFVPAKESQSAEPAKAATSTVDPMLGQEAGQIRYDNGLKMKLIWCPPGKLKMGGPDSELRRDETPDGEEVEREFNEDQVEATLTKGFWLGKTEVTQDEWNKVMSSTPWQGKKNVRAGDDYPATYVSWDDAVKFCRKLTEQEHESGRLSGGWEYTLPSEAQWEYGCRAGTTTTYSFGDDELKLSEYGWWGGTFADDGNADTILCAQRVGQKKPNAWGLHDMHGNVSEWCRDWYAALTGGTDPVGPAKGLNRILRGGSWVGTNWSCSSTFRHAIDSSNRLNSLGFRVALVSAERE